MRCLQDCTTSHALAQAENAFLMHLLSCYPILTPTHAYSHTLEKNIPIIPMSPKSHKQWKPISKNRAGLEKDVQLPFCQHTEKKMHSYSDGSKFLGFFFHSFFSFFFFYNNLSVVQSRAGTILKRLSDATGGTFITSSTAHHSCRQ